jgi:hypothetical protein
MRDEAYKFILQQHLSPDLAESFRTIPGVAVWKKRPGMFVPYNAGWLIEKFLRGRGIAHTIRAPARSMIDAERAIATHAVELDEGIWDEFMYDFQCDVTRARIAAGGGHIFSPAGVGKTIMAIVWALSAPGPVVAVTKSRARRQWAAEVKRFTSLQPFTLMPTADYRKRDQWRTLDEYFDWCQEIGQRPFIVMGWEGLRTHLRSRDGRAGILDMAPTSVIFDESHHARQKKRADYDVELDANDEEVWSSEQLGNISDMAQQLGAACTRRLNTTASPIVNRLADLWAQLTLVEIEEWGKTARKFEYRYCNAVEGEFGGVHYEPPGTSNVTELDGRLSFTVSRIPYAKLAEQLPPKRRMVTRIPVSQQSKGEAMSREDRTAYKREVKEIGAGIAAGKASKWQKERMTELLRLDASEKKKAFIKDRVPEIITMGKGKVLIFTGRKRSCVAMEKSLRGSCKGLQIWMANGDTSTNEFDDIHQAYMAHPGPCVLIGTYQAWGTSLNLQDTDHMLVTMLPITPGEVEQLEGRGARFGQTRPLLIEYLIAEYTIDERLAAILLDKLPAVEQVTGEAAGISEMSSALKGTDDLEGLLDSLVADMDDWEC